MRGAVDEATPPQQRKPIRPPAAAAKNKINNKLSHYEINRFFRQRKNELRKNNPDSKPLAMENTIPEGLIVPRTKEDTNKTNTRGPPMRKPPRQREEAKERRPEPFEPGK